jgi:hypothetical protein
MIGKRRGLGGSFLQGLLNGEDGDQPK